MGSDSSRDDDRPTLVAWAHERTRADPGFELGDVQRRVDREARIRIHRNRYGRRTPGERVRSIGSSVLVLLAWTLPVVGFAGLAHVDGYYQHGRWHETGIDPSVLIGAAVLALVSSILSAVYVSAVWVRAGLRWYPPHAAMTVYLVIADVLMLVFLDGPLTEALEISTGPAPVVLAWTALVTAAVAFLCQIVTAGRRRVPGAGVDWHRLHPRDAEELTAERNEALGILFDKRMLREYDRDDLASRPIDGLV
ncbi:hypothetical protein [Brevibacterium samyangense]|uniref:Uncharacterized protein n=1 Tax=Brevibacterium samyangense TaxID=366888 RepID=A0ABP5F5L9_9MICO